MLFGLLNENGLWEPRVSGGTTPAPYSPAVIDEPTPPPSATAPVDPESEPEPMVGPMGFWNFPVISRAREMMAQPYPAEEMGLGVSSQLANAGHMNMGTASEMAHAQQEGSGLFTSRVY